MFGGFRVDGEGHLRAGGLRVSELAERFGTPLFVMDEDRIRENYRRFREAFAKRWGKVVVAYAYKANSTLAVCRVLHQEGAGAEVVSEGELRAALKTGVPPERIFFNGNAKSEAEIELAVERGVKINLDSLEEIGVVGEVSRRLGKRAEVGLRVNPGIEVPTHPYIATGVRDSKFGLELETGEALEGFKRAVEEGLRVEGVHFHLGSQLLDLQPFEEGARRVMEFVSLLKKELGLELEFLDLGGGLGVPERPGERGPSPEDLASRVASVLGEYVGRGLKPFTLVLEPGRYLVSDAGLLLLRVEYVKPRKGRTTWICVDGGTNLLLRPALMGTYYHMELADRMGEEGREVVNVGGPLCQAGDVIGRERKLPSVRRGDLLVVFNAGAYTLTMANQYNSRPRAAVVMVKGEKAEVIRKRETCEDIWRYDTLPSWL
ncbi:MAG: diaminopimelate decarboxylase [Candidatus Hadarchaeales archaeon]